MVSIVASIKAHLKIISNTVKGSTSAKSTDNGETSGTGKNMQVYVYALTAEEWKLLDEHKGWLYMEYHIKDCPDKGKLTLAEYKKHQLTPAFFKTIWAK